ncbi:MAG: nitrous oxide reductase accessory protein NosL [Burkholderiales bacterium]|uniref:nitrous oxide reductase accessory protein NosL n=1 Tax=Inhella sp. TaxID=1921806 RepID=UPI001AC67B20|nr:nitrous oxide reductase accessory protein NosL [Burkholderiales bacterium]
MKPSPTLTRRRCLGCAGMAMFSALLPGCAREDGPATAQDFSDATACALDGMLLAEYPGPKAQIHHQGDAKPQFLCDPVEMFSLLLRPEQVKAVRAAFVQDMEKTDWERPRQAWIDAKTAFYVRDSRLMGAMGPTFASFARREAAEAFAKTHGGQLLAYAEVTPELADLSGGGQHDQKM